MKTLYLIRHAKSSWDNQALSDFDRPLNDRGKRDAPRMGKWLKKNNELPDIIISSPAKRAKRTTEKIAEEINYDTKKVHWEKQLYETSVATWLRIICGISNTHDSAYVVGHNDTLTQMVNYLTDASLINVPTCGIVRIDFKTHHWAEISRGTGYFKWHQFPKGLDN